MGKYRCLLCQKEFSSESGVKYHIIKAHSEVRKWLGLLWAGPCLNTPVLEWAPSLSARHHTSIRVCCLAQQLPAASVML